MAHRNMSADWARQVAHGRVRGVAVSVIAGMLSGGLCVLYATTYANLVFAGPLVDFIAIGLSMGLIGACIHAGLIALASSYPGSVGGVCAEIVILGVVVATLSTAGGEGQPPSALLATVIATTIVASLLVAAVYLGLGGAGLGNLIRYIPYPVMGGFIAGIGWLLVVGAMELSVSAKLDMTSMAWLFESTTALRWGPALLIGGILFTLERKVGNFLWVPIVLTLSTAAVYGVAWAHQVDVAALTDGGWLLGPISGSSVWPPLLLTDALADVRWMSIIEVFPAIAAYSVTMVIGLLLVGASLEIVTGRDIALNAELKTAGVSNLVAALAGGFPGYHYIGCTSLHHKVGADSRVAGVTAASICVVTLLAGTELLQLLPRMIAAALLFFIGIGLLATWLVESFARLTRADYLVVVTVFVFVVLVGLMEGVMIGLILGIALFAFNYSRINVIKTELTAATLRSRASRPSSQLNALRQLGDAVSIYRLDGYIFFGTINRLLERIRERANDHDRALRSVILDFRAVRGMDSSAAIYFSRLPSLAERHGFNLIIASAHDNLWKMLQREGLRQERRLRLTGQDIPRERRVHIDTDAAHRVLIFASLDDALEWCEDELLESSQFDANQVTERSLLDVNWPLFTDSDMLQQFLEFASTATFEPGEVLTQQGAPFQCLYFIVSGTVNVSTRTSQGEQVRLRSMGEGASVGEVSMYLGTRATADVIASTHTVAFALSKAALARIRSQAPVLHARLHEALAHTLASRLADNVRLIDNLLH